jgi:integrase
MPDVQGSTAFRTQGHQMRGSITKKGNGRHYVVTHHRHPDGKRYQSAHGGYRTKKEAEAALREVLNRMDRGSYVASTGLTVATYLGDEWLPSIRGTVRQGTHNSYADNMRLHVVPYIGGIRLQSLTPVRLNALYCELLATGSKKSKPGGLGATTVRYVHTILSKALKDAVEANLLTVNPATRAKPPKAGATKGRDMATWTAAQLRTFLGSIEGDRLYAAWVTLASTGMRRGELLGLRWTDVDLDAATLSISRSLTTVGYQMQMSDTKTKRGARMVSLDEVTVAALRTYRRRQSEERLAWGPGYQTLGLVFTKENGSPIHPDRFSQMFRRLSKATELPSIRLHDLRHTHASIALRAGVHAKVISERLGHSTIAMTIDVYAHAIPAMQAEAAEQVAALVWAIPS